MSLCGSTGSVRGSCLAKLPPSGRFGRTHAHLCLRDCTVLLSVPWIVVSQPVHSRRLESDSAEFWTGTRCNRTTFHRRNVVLKFQDQVPSCQDYINRMGCGTYFQDHIPPAELYAGRNVVHARLADFKTFSQSPYMEDTEVEATFPRQDEQLGSRTKQVVKGLEPAGGSRLCHAGRVMRRVPAHVNGRCCVFTRMRQALRRGTDVTGRRVALDAPWRFSWLTTPTDPHSDATRSVTMGTTMQRVAHPV